MILIGVSAFSDTTTSFVHEANNATNATENNAFAFIFILVLNYKFMSVLISVHESRPVPTPPSTDSGKFKPSISNRMSLLA